MATPPRLEHRGAIHHVVNRGTRKALLFVDLHDYTSFLRRLRVVIERRQWCCLAYCLMPNHVHLVVETPEPTLGAGVRDVFSVHAKAFNKRHGHTGTTVEGPYRARIVTSDEYFAQLLRYVARNPVKAGLAAQPEDWRWSSHAALLRGRTDGIVDGERTAALLEPWGGPPEGRYGRLFRAGDPLAERFADTDPADARPALDVLLTDEDGIRAARAHGYKLSEIAAELAVSEATVSRRARRP